LVTKETIEQFFKGECDAQQAAAVKLLFEEKPELFEEYISEAEWEAFSTQYKLPVEKSEEIWRKVHHEAHRKPLVYYIKRLSVAASLLLGVCALAYYLFFSTAVTTSIIADGKRPSIKTIYNGDVKDEYIALSDSSYVWLMPGSSISYPESFIQNRTINLSGGAHFEVKRDTAHPFVVHTDSIFTTVLGTKFTVTGNLANGNIEVALHEGKVSVEKSGVPFNGKKVTYILNPGEIFSYNALHNEAIVEKKIHEGSKKPVDKNASRSAAGPANSSNIIQGDNWYMFNNQSLAQTFDQLEQLYNTNIEYNKADIKGMTFIGKVDNSDSLFNILKAIALLNNLTVIQQPNGYLIRK
jgi:transmembrane sensor